MVKKKAPPRPGKKSHKARKKAASNGNSKNPDDWVQLNASMPRWMRDYVQQVAKEDQEGATDPVNVSSVVRSAIIQFREKRGDA